jgi:HAD superfamily hydrolase (TIGR01509 family)
MTRQAHYKRTPRLRPFSMVRAVLFDLGDTLIFERVDDTRTLDKMKLHLRPHAEEVLEWLSRRSKIGLVSDTETSSEKAVRSALKKLGLEQFFSVVITSVDIGTTKPHPDIFLKALERLAVRPQEAVMIGNDPARDILGAKQLGMVTILCRSSSYYRKESERDADYVVDSLDEIPAIIRGLQRRGTKEW